MEVQCDNQGAVALVNSGYSKVPQLMHMLRCLFFIRATFDFSLRAVHVPGKDNILADAISRDNIQLLYSQVPEAARGRCLVPSNYGGDNGGPGAGLGVTDLVSTVSELFAAGLAESTHRAYESGCKRYIEFCKGVEWDPFPVSEDSLCLFVVKLFRDGLSAGTVKSYLVAVRHRSIVGDPSIKSMHRLEYVVKGAKKRMAGKSSRARRPIRFEELVALKQVWETSANRRDATMLWAAAADLPTSTH